MDTTYISLRNVLITLSLGVVFLSSPSAYAQKKKPQILEVGGKVRLDEGRFDGATIEVLNTDNNKIEKKINVTTAGKFDFELPYQYNYQLFFRKSGFYPKMLIVTTVIPEKVLERDPYFPPIQFVVTLFKVVPEIDPAFSKKPVGKIFYSAKVDNFDSESYFNDMQIRQEIDDEKTKLADKSYQKKLDLAKTLEEAEKLAEAIAVYQQAADLKPNDNFVKDKIKLLGEQIKLKEEQAKQNEEFKQLMAEGEEKVASKAFQEALNIYNKALKLQPDAQHPKEMLNKIKAAIAAQRQAAEEAAKQKALAEARQKQFEQVVSKGDSLFAVKSYPDATTAFNQALQLQPVAKHPQEMLNKIKAAIAAQRQAAEEAAKQKALAEARQKQFEQVVSKGDSLFAVKSYPDATTAFNQALQLQPVAKHPQEMLNKIKAAIAAQRQAAEEAAKQKALAEARQKQAEAKVEQRRFSSAIAKGDSLFGLKQYNSSIAAFNEALQLQPGATYPATMLEKIKHALAEKEQAAKEKQLAEQAQNRSTYQEQKDTASFHYIGVVEDLYLNNIKKADAAYAESMWTVARFFYYEAQKYKPSEKYPQKQVDLCDKAIESELLAKREKQYQDFISKADASLKTAEFTLAKFYYHQALKIKGGEDYPKRQLVEVKKAVQQKHASEEETQFRSFVKKADEAFGQKDISVARFYYKKALALKPDESYPKTQLNRLDSL
ncbi:hypothetical protein SD074_08700 [Prolixibacter sp. SD074]|nr:hypothetical protein SD074_08700 [Prolixibacter sp. SD074]